MGVTFSLKALWGEEGLAGGVQSAQDGFSLKPSSAAPGVWELTLGPATAEEFSTTAGLRTAGEAAADVALYLQQLGQGHNTGPTYAMPDDPDFPGIGLHVLPGEVLLCSWRVDRCVDCKEEGGYASQCRLGMLMIRTCLSRSSRR
jgi:hypothetical protein